MIKKAMIFAAGKGERMGNLTQHCPKPLLEINGQALIVYHIKKLAAMGVTDCLINLRYLGEKIQHALSDGHQFNLRLHYSHEVEALETAGGIIYALDFFENQPFVLVSADVFTDYPFETLLKQLPALQAQKVLGHLVMVDNPAHHEAGDFAIQSSGLLGFEGQKLNYAGVGVYHPQLFAYYSPGYRKIGEVMHEAISRQQLTGEYYQGQWLNVDTPERLAMAKKIIF